tara:strand:- start:333 stop:575 length:243 start_codon:yes stop_codon:yes gene_type:complete
MTDKETRKKAVDWMTKRIKEGKPVWTPKKKKKMEAYTAKKKKKEKPTEKPAKIDKELFWANRKKNAYRNKKVYPKIGKDY